MSWNVHITLNDKPSTATSLADVAANDRSFSGIKDEDILLFGRLLALLHTRVCGGAASTQISVFCFIICWVSFSTDQYHAYSEGEHGSPLVDPPFVLISLSHLLHFAKFPDLSRLK